MDLLEPFFAAVKANDSVAVGNMLESAPQLASARDESGVSALMLAIYNRADDVSVVLRNSLPNLDLFEASAAGIKTRVEEILNDDPEAVHSRAPDGFSALALAAFFGHPELVELLLARGAEPNRPARNALAVTPLHAAAACRDADRALPMVAALLAAGADPDVAQQGGWRPLHQAARHGPIELVRLLLDHGADPAVQSDDGMTPLAMAEAAAQQEIAALLHQRTTRR